MSDQIDNVKCSDDNVLENHRTSITSDDLKAKEVNSSEIFLDLNIVLEDFQKCIKDKEQIYMDEYLRGYIELNKFFQLLGSVFNFVASDVQKKVTILQCYRKGGAGDYYFSAQSMIEYEKDNNILSNTSQNSGSRTLLRLHRASEFITEFLEELMNASDDTKLGSVTSEIYTRTLAKHHSWLISKSVAAILYMMPTKKYIIEKITKGNDKLRIEYESLLPKVMEVIRSVYGHTQKLYEDYDILNLP